MEAVIHHTSPADEATSYFQCQKAKLLEYDEMEAFKFHVFYLYSSCHLPNFTI
jgi:hypothetical protein